MPTPLADSYNAPSGATLYAGRYEPAPVDFSPPTLVGAIAITNLTSTSYTFTSPVGSDNVAVTQYRWRLNSGGWTVIAGGGRTAATGGRTPGSTDLLDMAAGDAAGNWSPVLSLNVTLNAGSSAWAGVSALLQATDEDSWVQINAGNFSDAWPNQDYLPLKAPEVPAPVAPMVPWASVALDDLRGRVFLFGGGHANTNDNAVYTWEASDRLFHLAYFSTDNVLSSVSGLWHNVEDWALSPPSAHTYASNAFLPNLNKFITFGGAAWNTGHAYFITDAEGAELMPLAGGYTLSMDNAFQGMVGGGTGSNVRRNSTAGVTLNGANAWSPRPYGQGRPDSGSAVVATLAGHLEGMTAYRQEGGHDVLYVRCSTQVGGTSDNLVRIEYQDNDYRNDLLSIVGIPAGGDAYSDQGGAIDPVRGIVVNCGYPATPISFWDLSTAGPSNVCVTPPISSIGGDGVTSYIAAMNAHKAVRAQSYGMGMCFDAERGRFVMWGGLRAVWVAPTPADLLNGWQINELAADGTQSPVYDGGETGVHGKFKYSAAMDCYIGVNASGNEIWAFKPQNWNPKV